MRPQDVYNFREIVKTMRCPWILGPKAKGLRQKRIQRVQKVRHPTGVGKASEVRSRRDIVLGLHCSSCGSGDFVGLSDVFGSGGNRPVQLRHDCRAGRRSCNVLQFYAVQQFIGGSSKRGSSSGWLEPDAPGHEPLWNLEADAAERAREAVRLHRRQTRKHRNLRPLWDIPHQVFPRHNLLHDHDPAGQWTIATNNTETGKILATIFRTVQLLLHAKREYETRGGFF